MGSVDWIFIVGGAGLAVNGRIRDVGQNVLQSSFRTLSGSSPSYGHIFPLSHSFIKNTIIIPCINNKICINNNNNRVINNNNYGRL